MKLKLEDGREIDVDYEYLVEEHGCPSNGWDEPGEATIVSVTEVYHKATGEDVELSVGERERLEQQIGELIDSEPPADYFADI